MSGETLDLPTGSPHAASMMSVHACVFVQASVCMRERRRQRQRKTERGGGREGERGEKA